MTTQTRRLCQILEHTSGTSWTRAEETGSSRSGKRTGPLFRRCIYAISFDCLIVLPHRAKLDASDDVDEIETLVRKMGRRWMGFTEDGDDKTIASKNKGDDDGLDAMDGLAILS